MLRMIYISVRSKIGVGAVGKTAGTGAHKIHIFVGIRKLCYVMASVVHRKKKAIREKSSLK